MSHRFALLLTLTCGACIPYDDPEPSEGCDREVHVLEPGHTVQGQDPQALLAPLYGTWRGPLEWRVGGETQLSLSIERDPEAPLYRKECTPPGIRTSANARLITTDGALDETLGTAVNWAAPEMLQSVEYGYLDASFRYIVIDGSGKSSWRGSVAAKIPGIERYGDSGGLFIDLEYDLDTLQPRGGVFTYQGQAEATRELDTFDVATWHVE